MQNGKRGATYPAKLMLFDANLEQGGGKRDKVPGQTMQRRPLSASVWTKDGKLLSPLSAFIHKQKQQTTRIGTAGHLEEKGSRSQDVRSPAGEAASNMHRLKPSAMPTSPQDSNQESGPRSRFDFSTMEDGALEEQPVKQHRSRLIERKSSRLGSMFKDTWESFKAYDGSSFNLQAVETDDVLGSKLKFGFRSQALKMQVAITEKLRMAEDEASSFQIYKIDRSLPTRISFLDRTCLPTSSRSTRTSRSCCVRSKRSMTRRSNLFPPVTATTFLTPRMRR